ncbi:hypothetical protein ACTA71_011821 [Dictyostelium dimigraforme]
MKEEGHSELRGHYQMKIYKELDHLNEKIRADGSTKCLFMNPKCPTTNNNTNNTNNSNSNIDGNNNNNINSNNNGNNNNNNINNGQQQTKGNNKHQEYRGTNTSARDVEDADTRIGAFSGSAYSNDENDDVNNYNNHEVGKESVKRIVIPHFQHYSFKLLYSSSIHRSAVGNVGTIAVIKMNQQSSRSLFPFRCVSLQNSIQATQDQYVQTLQFSSIIMNNSNSIKQQQYTIIITA